MLRDRLSLPAVVGALALVLAACGGSDGTSADTASGSEVAAEATSTDGEAPRVVVTTAILGDIVTQVLEGTDAEVEVVMPPGVDPHAYEPSASDGVALREADLVVANGLQLEEALLDVLAAAEDDGVRVLEVADGLDGLLEAGADSHGDEEHSDEKEHSDEGEHGEEGHAVGEEHSDEGEHGEEGHAEGEEHSDEEHSDEKEHGEEGDDHDHGGLDPHVWLDPLNVGEMADVIADAYAEIAPDAADLVEQNAADLATEMADLDAELQELVAELDADQRRIVTNHEALGYLAARYDLEVVATVLPGTTTDVDVTAAGFTELVETIREEAVPAIFADTSSSDRLAQSLASEVGDIEVVELFTESLGEPGSGADTIGGMIRTNVERIVAALG